MPELTPEQIALRYTGIGSSEAYDAVHDPYKLVAQKLKLVEPFEGSVYTYWGAIHEPTVAAEYAKRRGLKVGHE